MGAVGNAILSLACFACALMAARSPDSAIFIAAALIIAAMPTSPKEPTHDP